MTYNAIIEDRESEGFTASIQGWPDFKAAGATREEVLSKLRQILKQRLSRVEVVPLEVDAPEDVHPWKKFAGMYQDDPLFDQVEEDIKNYRREIDAETAT